MAFPPIVAATTTRLNVLQVAQQAMGELGMTRPSTITGGDETGTQLRFLLNGLGTRLSRYPLWEQTRAEWLITTTTVQAYALPEDWLVPLAGTEWDRSGRWPLLGPKTPTEWQYLESGFGVAAPQYRYRFFNGYLNVLPAPTAGLTWVLEYLSANWLYAEGATAGTYDDPVATVVSDGDYPLIDTLMLVTGLKLMWLEAKGLDSSKAKEDFEAMMGSALANAAGAPVLTLSPMPRGIFLTEWNAPDTGYGV